MTRIPSSIIVAGVVVAFAHGASADVFIDCSLTAGVRFVSVHERTEGTPFGRAGLRFQGPSWGFSSINGVPEEAFAGETTWFDGPRGDYDGLLPHVGDEWGMGQSISLAQSMPGYGLNVSQSVVDLTFLNQTNGLSVYEIDMEIDWALAFSVWCPTALMDTAVLFAAGNGISVTGTQISIIDGFSVTRDGTTPETTITGLSKVHLEVGRTEDDPAADLSRVQLTITMQGYVSSIPTPAVPATLGTALLIAARGRRRPS